MNSSSDNRETGNQSYRTAVVARQILWLMPLPHCRWRDTVWPNLQKGMKNIALSGKTNKITKNHHLMGNWLLCPYVWFEVATVSCWSYRKRILDFCTYTNTIVVGYWTGQICTNPVLDTWRTRFRKDHVRETTRVCSTCDHRWLQRSTVQRSTDNWSTEALNIEFPSMSNHQYVYHWLMFPC